MSEIKISSNLAISENGFLFMPLTGESFTLNEIGVEIVNFVKSGINSEEIINEVIETYDVEKNIAEKDILDFIAQLKNFKVAVEG